MKRVLQSFGAVWMLCAGLIACAGETAPPPVGLPTASVFSAKLIPDAEGIVSWKTLASVEPIKQGSRMVPRFSNEILALDRQEVRVHGFILALDTDKEQAHFLISAVPVDCPFCLPAGPDAIIEVFAESPVRYGYQPIVLAGRFAVLKDDPSGVLYRLTDAKLATSGSN